MRIWLTLEEALARVYDWEQFCKEQGFSEWCVNEGGGDVEVSLTEEEVHRYGIFQLTVTG